MIDLSYYYSLERMITWKRIPGEAINKPRHLLMVISDSRCSEPSFVAACEVTDVMSGLKMLIQGRGKGSGVTSILFLKAETAK